jgi:hypothetical protein
MPFEAGRTKAGGRRKGVPNKATQDQAAMSRMSRGGKSEFNAAAAEFVLMF